MYMHAFNISAGALFIDITIKQTCGHGDKT